MHVLKRKDVNMRILLDGKHFKEIMNTCKSAILKTKPTSATHNAMTRIQLLVSNGNVTATATDGHKLASVTVPAIDYDMNADSELLIPWIKPSLLPEKQIEIIDNDKEIVVTDSWRREKYEKIFEKFPEWKQIMEETKDHQEIACFQPKLLAETILSFSGTYVSLSYKNKKSALVITDGNNPKKKALVMPYYAKKEGEDDNDDE